LFREPSPVALRVAFELVPLSHRDQFPLEEHERLDDRRVRGARRERHEPLRLLVVDGRRGSRERNALGDLDRGLFPVLELDGTRLPALHRRLEQCRDLSPQQSHDDRNARRPRERIDQRGDELAPGHEPGP